MANFMNQQKMAPELILSSSAVRAKETAELFRADLEHDAKWKIVDDFYLAPPQIYLDQLARLSCDVHNVILIGHNPGLETLVQQLAGQWHRMPTAAIAGFSMPDQHWQEISFNASSIQFLGVWRPKEIDLGL